MYWTAAAVALQGKPNPLDSASEISPNLHLATDFREGYFVVRTSVRSHDLLYF